jgi:hypothetical protein
VDPSIRAFICYRRSDAFVREGTGGRPDFFVVKNVKAALERVGFTEVFLDIDPRSGSRALHHFENRAFRAIENCDLFVVVIGTKWLDLLDERARRGSRDAVAREIHAAANYEKSILPILVDGATMPARELLPEDIRDFTYQPALSVSSTDTVDAIATTLMEPATAVERTHKVGNKWRNLYLFLCIAAYYLCAINPHVVGALEYGWDSWLGMAKAWGGLFIWPIFFLPFALVALYRPFSTLLRFIATAPDFASWRPYLIPLVIGTILAGATWLVEVYDPRQVPWTVYAELPRPGCQTGPAIPNDLTRLPAGEQQRWKLLAGLSSYDQDGYLENKYQMQNRDVPFWLKTKCWPNVFFYLTSPVYLLGVGGDERYLHDRRPVDAGFNTILDNASRNVMRIPNSWSAWAYRASFFILAWLGLSGVMMASFYSMVALRDPNSDAIITLPREDAALCLTYSLGTLMTWLPFRMNTEYAKFLYQCLDPANCTLDPALYLPDLLLGIMLLLSYTFITVCLIVQYRRVALTFLGLVMVAASLSGAILVFYHRETIARLAELWQFYVLLAIPSVAILVTFWFLFDPAAVHSRDFRQNIE